jgi:hypothetical protein
MLLLTMILGEDSLTAHHHFIEIYEPYEYTGPNPLDVDGVAVLHDPMRHDYYLLDVTSPFEYNHQKIEQLLVAPRYNGDKIERAMSSACTVSIACVPVGTHLNPDDPLSFEDLLRWGVGKITLA